MASATREELDRQLQEIRDQMQEILAMEESDQMEAFAGIAEAVLEAAGPDDHDYVWTQLQCMLRDAGLIPGDDEPCADA